MMKFLKSSKLRLSALVIALSVLFGMVCGETIAFFTAKSESTGVFTFGNVYIEMTEAAVKYDSQGNLIENTEASRVLANDTSEGGLPSVHDYGIVTPGQTIYKDPTIQNVGDVNAWIAAKVIIEDGAGDIFRLYKYNDYYNDIDIERMLAGGLLDEEVHVGDWMGNEYVCFNDNYAMVQIPDRDSGRYEFYFIMLKQFAPGESVELFDTFFINPYFGSSEMAEFAEFKITVQAFGVQVSGFASCYDAMTVAFAEHFSNVTTNQNGQ